MREITHSIPEKDFSFFTKLIKSLEFVTVKESKKADSKNEFLDGMKESIQELNLIKSGKLCISRLN